MMSSMATSPLDRRCKASFLPFRLHATRLEHINTTHRDKAGAYGIQEATGGSLIQGINGCYYNVVGFPLYRFCKEVRSLMDSRLL